MDILTSQACVIKDKIVGPDCDLYTCVYNGLRFAICTSQEEGTSLCVDIPSDLDVLETLFQNHLEDQTEIFVDFETAYWIAERCFLENDYVGVEEIRENRTCNKRRGVHGIYAAGVLAIFIVFTFFLHFCDSRFYFRGIYFVCIKKIKYKFKTKGNLI